MRIVLPNKSRLDNEQKELRDMSLLKFIFKGKSIFFNEDSDEIILLLLYFASFIITTPFSSFLSLCNMFIISFIIFILLFILIAKIEYNMKTSNKLNSEITQKLQEELNEKYVSRDDHETVYLLHELIKKYGLEYSSIDQSDDYRLKLELNTNNFIKFESKLYNDKDVYNELRDNVLNDKKLTEDETQKFYYKYIEHKIKPEQKKIKSLEEHYALSKRLKDKNKR